ncbi:MAG: mechanosensitive ion channel [Flavobacteriales bacterium]|nr:mechanosensitive ion channel [Flavobacteriales bacterium]
MRSFLSLRKLLLLALLAWNASMHAQDTTGLSMQAIGEEESVMLRSFKPSVPADLVIANRHIITLRSEVFSNSPEQRVGNIHKRLEEALAKGGPGVLSDSVLFGGCGILIDGHPLMFIGPLDLDPSMGEDIATVKERTKERLRTAIADQREMRDSRAMVRNVGLVALYSAALAAVLFLLGRLRRLIHRKAEAFIQRSMERSGIKGGLSRSHTLFLIAQRLAMLVIGVLMLVVLYFWATAVLGRIPLTRAWSESMFGVISDAALWAFDGVVEALPGLAMVTFIFLITRAVAKIIGGLFTRIQNGELEVTWIDASIAAPTRRVIVLLIWVFGLVIAYPYIPGSSSKAFQGVSVLAGVMLSLGSSGVISQAVSGLALMFNRLARVGECIAVGDVVTGVVKQIGYFNTTIVTSYGEEVTVPNSIVMSSKLTNLSRHPGAKGILWTTGVTIGYDAPWRQVHAMLLEAARMTNGLASDPAPKVVQHALNDFYVDYRLTVVVQGPFRQTLSDLHANIQDVFNANGVQIMSPHYMGDTDPAKVVPPEKQDPGIKPI